MKKFGLPIFVGLVIGVVAGAGYLWRIRGKPTPTEPLIVPTPSPAQLLTWNDPNGFTFQYPEGLSVDKHDEDNENYAHIEFTHSDHPGALIVWGKDPARGVSDTASWVKAEKRFTGASVLDTELGGQPAKKAMITDPGRLLVVGTVYDDIIWSVETTLEDMDFWDDVHSIIVDSFAFTPVKAPGSGATSEPATVVDDVVVDEEEVIE